MLSDPDTSFDLSKVRLRPAEDSDLPVLLELLAMGVPEGAAPDRDTGTDIRDFRTTYVAEDGRGGLWVAVCENDVIGMVGVLRRDESVAQIRRLRVHPAMRRRGIGSKLMERAIAFCRERDYLKVILDTRIEEEPAIRIFRKFGFQLARSRDIGGRTVFDFYLDMYREPEIRE